MEEEADSRLISHVANARPEGFKNFQLLCNDSEVVAYFSAYFDQFKTKNIEKIRMKYGLKERQQNIPIHRLADILDSGKTRTLLETHILTSCDFTSKVLSKCHPSVQNQIDFCTTEDTSEDYYISQQAEKYLMKFSERN